MDKKMKLYHLTINGKLGLNYDEAIKKTNSIRKQIKQYCEAHDCPCCAIIGTSKVIKHRATIHTAPSGKKEMKCEFRYKESGATTDPHIHIVIYSGASKEICEQICERIQKKTDIKDFSRMNPHEDMDYLIRYLLEQCTSIRSYAYQANMLEKGEYFCELAYSIDRDEIQSRSPVFRK